MNSEKSDKSDKYSAIIFWPVILLASFMIAVCVKFFNHNPINLDGILYLDVAKLYTEQGLTAAMKIYPWPFFSVILSCLSQFFHTNLLNTAFWLNNIFMTITIVFWLGILKEFVNNENESEIANKNFFCRIVVGGSVLILLYPSLNHLRGFIIRDTGYWAFLFAGIWCIFQSLKTTHPREIFFYGLLYSVCFLIATLFRLEGAVVWVLAPCIFLHLATQTNAHDSLKFNQTYNHKFNQYLKFFAHEILFLVMMIGLIFWKLSDHLHHFSQLGRINYFWKLFQETTQAFVSHFSIGFILIFFKDLFNTLTLFYSLLIFYGGYYWHQKNKKNNKNKIISAKSPSNSVFLKLKLLFVLLIIQFVMPLVFYLQTGVTTERYLLPFCLTALLLAPFAFVYLSRQLLILASFIFSITAYGGIIPYGHSKAYLTDAGKWLKQHSQASDNIYSNSREVLFYAGRETLHCQLSDSPDQILALLKNPDKNPDKKFYNYLAIRLNKNDNAFFQERIYRLSQLSQQPVKVFHNKHDDKVMIFYGSH